MPKSGFVAIIGRPNVGKSTLLNRLIGHKVSIVSEKPQTTRHRILGIITDERSQIVFVDTPGIHKPGYELNRRMMQIIYEALQDVDLVILMVDVGQEFGQGDRFVLDMIKEAARPTILAINKVDAFKKSRALPIIDQYQKEYGFLDYIPISALRGDNVDVLIDKVFEHLPEGEPLYPPEYITDKSERFIVGELIRERVLAHARQELPFSTAVVVEKFDESERETRNFVKIIATIIVERESQKAIVIGRGGQMIKKIGTEARKEIEAFLGAKVYLDLFVRVQERWRDLPRFLDEIGIGTEKKI